MNGSYLDEYNRWLCYAKDDTDIIDELLSMSDINIENAFFKNLEFGTGGLRGIIGAGTNRMNTYTIAKASQGLANYLNGNYENPSVVIGYDTRIKSDIFSKTTADVLVANGIRVYYWVEALPVPTVSFAVRFFNASAGVMITASHNPCIYNGYKVYADDGCQITTESAKKILKEIEKTDVFLDVKRSVFDNGVISGCISYINENVLEKYLEKVKMQSVLYGYKVNKNVKIVYTPLNGTGLKPVTRILSEMGYENVIIVKEQEKPNGRFPTCTYPNPEEKEAMKLGIEYAKRNSADLLLATDPDCDRVGIAVRDDNNEYVLLSGNETGILLLDYVCSRRKMMGTMPPKPVMVKTIVTTDLSERIANHYGVETRNVLTGFKYIGEQIGILEKQGKEDNYIFGFEESYGYLTGTYVRDKDGVNAAYLICEMYAYYATQGIGLIEKLHQLYKKYGFCINTLHSYYFEGATGYVKMQTIMSSLRKRICSIGGIQIEKIKDYAQGVDGLPKSNVLKYYLENHCSVVIRPSGTEPKLKLYISVTADNEEASILKEREIVKEFSEKVR